MAKDTTNKDITSTSIDDEAPVVVAPKVTKVHVRDDGHMSGERMQVTIAAAEGELGSHAVFLAINGHGFNIPRGVPVELPVEAIEVLDNATMTRYEDVGGKTVERQVQRFNYTAKPIKSAKAQ